MGIDPEASDGDVTLGPAAAVGPEMEVIHSLLLRRTRWITMSVSSTGVLEISSCWFSTGLGSYCARESTNTHLPGSLAEQSLHR